MVFSYSNSIIVIGGGSYWAEPHFLAPVGCTYLWPAHI